MELFGYSSQAGLSMVGITGKGTGALLIRLQMVFNKRVRSSCSVKASLPKALILRNGCSFASKLNGVL